MFAIVETKEVNFSDMSASIDEKIKEVDKKIENLKEIKVSLQNFKNNEQQSITCPHIRAFLNNFKEE